ncbi:hypothetical protein ACV1DR_18590 [Aeromonas jandaei]
MQWREARPVAAVAAPELPQALTAAIAGEIEKAAAKARAEKEQELGVFQDSCRVNLF